MKDAKALEKDIKSMIDKLKALCYSNSIGNTGKEENVITTIFLYKFLNDKFFYNLEKYAKEIGNTNEVILNNPTLLNSFYDTYSDDVAFKYEDTIQHLAGKTTSENFSVLFDDALEDISNNPRNETFNVKTAGGGREPLFTRITESIDSDKRNNFAKDVFGVITKQELDFSDAFITSFDFYSAIFEYLIHDYNVASGKYGEYFTPQSVSSIIAKILVQMSPTEDKLYEIYDPSAGSGSLVLHLANELGEGPAGKKAQVYTQDISDKSTRFLRLNLLLNGLTGSLEHVVEGDTLLNPSHFNQEGQPLSGLKQFDYIVANPPFKLNFSNTRDAIESEWKESEQRDGVRRFFAGIPNVPKTKPESMAIYLCFIQHILWSLKPNGKAAIVVPTGFLTAQSTIEKKIRETIIDKHWLKGVISMPSNIFATTGTNVSVLFIDKANRDGNVILIDASNLGIKGKDGNNQRTFLTEDETMLIEDTFINQKVIEDFSVLVTYDQIKEKNYSFSAGQYFDVKIEFVELTQQEFESKISSFSSSLEKYYLENDKLEKKIKNELDGLKYE